MTGRTMKFGTVGAPIATPKKPGGSVGAVMYSAELGLEALEIAWVRAVRVTEASCQAIQAAAAEHQVALSIHAPYFINLNASDDEWLKSRQRLMDAAHYGYLAGATDIVFHPGSYFDKDEDSVLKTALPRLAGCLEELRAQGNPVTLRPETMGKAAMLGSLEDALRMSREVAGVAPCLDFAHLYARPGDGSLNAYDDWARVVETYGKALGAEALKRLHIHISGIEYSPKGERRHLPLEESALDWRAVLRALKDFGCAGRVLCESPIMEEDALLLRAEWDRLV
jgi:deoxyribonuclease-4